MAKSLPSWECGLKSAGQEVRIDGKMSLPSWECGLKFHVIDTGILTGKRHSLLGSVD